MDPPPKEQCLTQQYLMEVTRKEGLRWEANLVAHVCEVLFTFYYLSLLVLSFHHMYERKPQGSKALRESSC